MFFLFQGHSNALPIMDQQCASGYHQGPIPYLQVNHQEKARWSLGTKQSANCVSGGPPEEGLLHMMRALPKTSIWPSNTEKMNILMKKK